MKLTKAKAASLAVIFLLYYIYMNSMRKVMIPQSSIMVPVILMFVFFLTVYSCNFKVVVRGYMDVAQCISWILIAIYVAFNNTSLVNGLATGGLIQLYVMVGFLLFASATYDWIEIWIRFSKLCVMLHGIATIFFYFSKPMYERFVTVFFTTDTANTLMRYYRKGYMCGLSSHFSSNGMILAIGILFFFETIRYQRTKGEKGHQLYVSYVCLLILLYALILSTKRSPFLAALAAIVITYIFSERKWIKKRVITVIVMSVLLGGIYFFLAGRIPGLSTLIDKSEKLSKSSAGILNGRLGLWRIALDMFLENPILGKGYGSFSEVATAAEAFTTSAHNYYLQIMGELGIVGLILYMVAFISGIILTFKQFEKICQCKNADGMKMVLCISLDIQFFVMIYSITATSLMYYSILVPYFLACTASKCINVNKLEEHIYEDRNCNVY